MKISHVLAALLLLSGEAMALPPPVVPPSPIAPNGAITGTLTGGALSGTDASGANVTATGGTLARTQAARAADVVNVKDFGAKGDGVTDDSASINAAFNYVRNVLEPNNVGQARVVFPQGQYLVNATLNWTNLKTTSIYIDADGANILAGMTGSPVIDALGSKAFSVRGMRVSTATGANPTIGMQIGRTGPASVDGGGSGIYLDAVNIGGNFSLTAFYNFAGEVNTFSRTTFFNTSTNTSSYALIEDGSNFYGITSAFVTNSAPVNVAQSFNENLFLNCSFENFGAGPAIWMEGTARHRYVTSYIAAVGANSTGTILYGSQNFLDFDVHSENLSLQDTFQLAGPNASVSLTGFHYREHNPQPSRSVFKLGAGVTSATMTGAYIELGGFSQSGAVVFNEPSAWTYSGYAYLQASAPWNITTPASGLVCIAGSCPGTFSSLGAGLVQSPTGVLSVSLPTPLAINSISALGAVSAVAFTSGSQFGIPNGGTTFPIINIAAPPSGGTQAAAKITTWGLNGGAVASGGSGYVVGDTINLLGGVGSTPQLQVTSVGANGVVTGLSGHFAGALTSLPANGASTSGGTGTGLTVQAMNWFVTGTQVTAAGGGYSNPTTASVSIPSGSGITELSGTPAFSVTLNSNLIVNGGAGQLLLDNTGTKAGVNGASGSPFIAEGASVDGSGIRTALTGASYPTPANTSLVRFTQTSTVASQTIVLPTVTLDGYTIEYVNEGSPLTALTFSPAVAGWTNGGTMAANTGIKVRWDATASAWEGEPGNLPVATNSTPGAVVVGSNISLSAGAISLTSANVVAALGFTPLQAVPSIANDTVLGNISGSSATPVGLTQAQLTALLVPGSLPAESTAANANPGSLGEYVSQQVLVGAAVSLTTATAANVTSISLTPGDWDVSGNVCLSLGAATVPTNFRAWAAGASAAFPSAPNGGAYTVLQTTFATGSTECIPTGTSRFQSSATQTIFLETETTFTGGTAAAYGFISARRAQ